MGDEHDADVAIEAPGAEEVAVLPWPSLFRHRLVRRVESSDRYEWWGFWSLVAAGAPVLGVVAGGPIVEHVSWRVIYIAQIPFTALALIAAAIILPGRDKVQRERIREPLDILGVITVGLGTVSLLFALNRGPEWGWTSPGVVVAFILSPLMLATFIFVERRARAPLIPLDYFRRRNFA